MNFLTAVEASGLAEWVRSSFVGYPLMIACHAIGMAIMVGLALALDMRVLGLFRGIPYTALNRFLGIAWLGFTINLLSGTGLFIAQATSYVTDVTFLLKMFFVIAGVVTAAMVQNAVSRHSVSWPEVAVPASVRLIAVTSIFCWVAATVTGRLIAYL